TLFPYTTLFRSQRGENIFAELRRCGLNIPGKHLRRNGEQVNLQLAAFGAFCEMGGDASGGIGGEFAIEVGHQLFAFHGMRFSRHNDTFFISLRSGTNKSFNSMRARKRRDRTVFTGIRSSSAISS